MNNGQSKILNPNNPDELKIEAPEMIGAVEVCCQHCKRTISMWSPMLEAQYGRGWLDQKVRSHKCH